MNKQLEESIKQLESLKRDRESFITGDKEHDEIYLKDIEAIAIAIKELKRQYEKILEENAIKEFILRQIEILEELLKKIKAPKGKQLIKQRQQPCQKTNHSNKNNNSFNADLNNNCN